ncbi:MAG: hypothetical protein EBR82_58955 [Caulobacteraceae bacterium]|nr:hypothetical protein [Caulobacteraceae bacterium]
MTYGGIQNNWDALKDDFDAVAYLPFGDEYWDAMNQIMNAIGNREIAKQPQVRWFEMTRMEVPFTVPAATTIAVAGTQVTIAEVQTLDSVTYSWPAVNDIYRHAKTGALVQVVAKNSANAAQITLKPLANATIVGAANDAYFYVGVSVGENSTAQAAKFVFDTLHTAKLQTFRNDTKSSSEALYNQLWYSQLENGVQTPYSNSRDIIYLQREHQVAIVNTFLAGDEPTNTNTTNALTGFQYTKGLIPTIFEVGTDGQCVDWSATGILDQDDFYDLEAALTKQDASIKNYMVWTTAKTSKLIEQAMLTYNQNANITLNKTQMEKTFWGEGAYADLMKSTYSFNNLVFNNKNFGLVRMGIFDNPQTFNTDNSNWQDYAVFLPLSQGGVDDGLGNMGKYIRLCHKPGAFMNMWQTGGRAAANKTATWELGVHLVSEIGFKFINANKYGLFY